MSKKSDSPYGTSFFVRIGLLLTLLLLVGGAMAYDRLILVPSGEDNVRKILSASSNADADRSAIHAAAGREPNETESIGPYSVEHWEFGRILPNLEGHKISIAFESDGGVAEAYSGGLNDDQRSILSRVKPQIEETASDANPGV